MADEEKKEYTKDDIDRVFDMYYDMKCRSIIGLSTLTGISVKQLETWNRDYKWAEELRRRDYHYSRDTYSRIRRLTAKQNDVIEDQLDLAVQGRITDIHRIAKLITAVNDTRNSLLKERQYDDLQQQMQTSSGNEELLKKLDNLKKDMKDLGINGISFDSSASILEGEEDGAQS